MHTVSSVRAQTGVNGHVADGDGIYLDRFALCFVVLNCFSQQAVLWLDVPVHDA